jgi:hypothetical protein
LLLNDFKWKMGVFSSHFYVILLMYLIRYS